jgi:drug/metabolite transporter (DMT)-like permease
MMQSRLNYWPIFAVITGELCFAVMGGLIKTMSTDLSNETMVFFRNALAFFIIVPMLWWTSGLKGFQTKKHPLSCPARVDRCHSDELFFLHTWQYALY